MLVARGRVSVCASRIAAIVVVLATKGSNGRALSPAILVSSSRTASDTVRPIAAKTAAASFLISPSTRVVTSSFVDKIPSPGDYDQPEYMTVAEQVGNSRCFPSGGSSPQAEGGTAGPDNSLIAATRP